MMISDTAGWLCCPRRRGQHLPPARLRPWGRRARRGLPRRTRAHRRPRPLAGQLSGGQAAAVIARGHGLTHLVHQAFATSLDQTFAVAAGLGLTAAITVVTFLRPTRTRTTPPSATGRHPPGLMTHIRQGDA